MLIVLRGNSGSGKSTTAKLLREKAFKKNPLSKIALIEQDYLRRIVLKEKENAGNDIVGLLQQTVKYALDHGYDVILEGILWTKKYEPMLEQLQREAGSSYWYYFDIPLEETLKRNSTKPNAHEFGETEMREWYQDKDSLDFIDERIIDETMAQPKILKMILDDTGL